MAKYRTAIFLVLTHWWYYSLALSRRYSLQWNALGRKIWLYICPLRIEPSWFCRSHQREHPLLEWRLVSCLRRLRLPTSVRLLCQFECRSHQAHRCIFPHFRPPVVLSTVSWFCCRSRCRPVSSWCRVSVLPLELRRPSARTQSP